MADDFFSEAKSGDAADFFSGATSSSAGAATTNHTADDSGLFTSNSAAAAAESSTASTDFSTSASAASSVPSLGVRTDTSVAVCFVDACAHIEPDGGSFQNFREKILEKFCPNLYPRAFISFLELRDDNEKEITEDNFRKFCSQSRSLNLTFPVSFQVLYPDLLQVLAREDFDIENDEHRVLEQKAIGVVMQLLDSSTLRSKYTSLFYFAPNQNLEVCRFLFGLMRALRVFNLFQGVN